MTHLVGSILLATDESELANDAARVALAVARQHGLPIEVIRVMETRGVPLPPPLDVAIGLGDELVGHVVHETQRTEIRMGLAAALRTPVTWPVHVAIGAPASAIVREARQSLAGMIVLGLRRHGSLGRALQDETALHVMRHAPCPVLGIVPSLRGLPERVVAAVDFSRASRAAARLARDLVAPGGMLTLVYVSAALPFQEDDGEGYVHALGVETGLARLRETFDRDDDVAVETAVLGCTSRRPVGEQLVEFAERTGTDLISLGSRRYGPLDRWLLGSVATDVARDGRVSLLVVPPIASASTSHA
ncbi:universal stress protein [Gemmatirosa kalamazoonensis]|nr:universal stress protein [Gemmatirosa kalamazoonensis]